VLARCAGGSTGADWRAARHMLNGKLEKIEDPLQKGRRLLDEAIRVDPTHEEARIYLAFLDASEGKTIRAAQAFRQLLRVAVDPANRGHAAIQLGLLYEQQDELRKAIACNRWIVMSGLAEDDPRFFVARFNLAAFHARSGNPRRSLRAFRDLLDLHPDKRDDIVRLLGRSPRARAAIDLQPGFAVALLETCPELFGSPEGSSDPSGSEETA
jgi:tetratricopeptide (TPR) repeat protein